MSGNLSCYKQGQIPKNHLANITRTVAPFGHCAIVRAVVDTTRRSTKILFEKLKERAISLRIN